jgi:hypothetical protein
MVKCGVLFEVRTEFLNNIWTSFGFKGLVSTVYSYSCCKKKTKWKDVLRLCSFQSHYAFDSFHFRAVSCVIYHPLKSKSETVFLFFFHCCLLGHLRQTSKIKEMCIESGVEDKRFKTWEVMEGRVLTNGLNSKLNMKNVFLRFVSSLSLIGTP